MADDLFGAAAESAIEARAPLAERLRPASMEDIVGQDHLVGDGRPLRRWAAGGAVGSLILWGPPGTGKTTLARALVRHCGAHFEALSAVNATVADIRGVVEGARVRLGERSVRTVLFLDEIHRFTRTQQDALLPHVENGLLTLVGATTESPWATVNRPLLSRCTVHQLHPLSEPALAELCRRGAASLGRSLTADAVARLISVVDGDGRRLLVALEAAASLGEGEIDLEAVETAMGAGARSYDTGAHYDAASALIKHLRASDGAQAMAWMLHMLDGGEDPRFIARRLVIFASEDIGVADRSALVVATAASRAVEFVGLPECRYNLAHAVAVLARAPKSREVCDLLAAAQSTALRPPPGQ